MTEIVTDEQLLVQNLTGVEASRIQLNDNGWTSRVFLVDNGKFVFKFPRWEDVKKEYVEEIKAYRILEAVTTQIQVPRVRWANPNNDFLGYEGVVGDNFEPRIASLSKSELKALGRSTGEFLKQMHQLHVDEPHSMGVEDEIQKLHEKYLGCRNELAKHFTKDEQSQLKVYIYETIPQTMRELGEDVVPCHGDLGYWNMILKPDGTLGFIDFGDFGYYDRSKDFLGLTDPTMLDAALTAYGDTELLRQKITIRQLYVPFYGLHYYAAKKDKSRIAEMIDAIRGTVHSLPH